ncbi:MAG: fumarate hydratase C-terminal domain-containing protein, partial [Clostridia bacterium]|nr:fumarate hydratase C-terminal domain-containing protein [Clostridia bacterium]
RNNDVIDAMKAHGAIYFCAIGGAGALASKSIKKCDVIAFPELGCESVKKMEIEDFALIVGIDSEGKSIFK